MAEKRNYSKRQVNDPVTTDMGKVPPQAVDIEEAVLGALMLEKDAVITVMDILKEDSFYQDTNRKIFAAIAQLASAQKPVDILTVTELLRSRNELDEVGGAYYITQLTSKVPSAAHVEYHARIIAQKYIQRELIMAASEIQKRAFDESIDVKDLLDFSEASIFKISEGNIKKSSVILKRLLEEALNLIEEAGKREDNLSGIPSGFSALDRLTSGWQKSDLVILAARPSMGKTAFVLSMARNMAVDYKQPLAFFSLEMSSIQLVNRLIVSETEISSEHIRNGKLSKDEWKKLESNLTGLSEAPLYIDDTPALSIYEFRSKCRRLKEEADIQCVIIDYLQLMTGPPETRGNREQEVSIISRSLKGVAKELSVPIIALSQLNRSVETRSGDKRPQLSDLRESGAIEQDADIVSFIHRPEYYGITEDAQGVSLVGMAEIIIAKHRNGALDDIRLRFQNQFAKFSELPPDFDFTDGLDNDNGFETARTFSSKMNQDVESEDPMGGGLAANNEFDSGEDPPF